LARRCRHLQRGPSPCCLPFPSARPGMTAAIHPNDSPIDVPGDGTSEKRHDARDVIRVSEVPRRNWEIVLENVRFDLIPAVAPASTLRLRFEPLLDFRRANQARR